MAQNLKPKCKYWDSCFRKNADHLKKFRHPEENSETLNGGEKQKKRKNTKPVAAVVESSDSESENEEKRTLKKRKVGKKANAVSVNSSSSSSSKPMRVDWSDSDDDCDTSNKTLPKLPKTSSLSKSARDIAWNSHFEACYGMKMPQDLFDFWDFAVEFAEEQKLEDPCTALEEALGLTLVGPFEILAGKFEGQGILSIHLHWRYRFDPPEFTTILNDADSGLHFGYFRDIPADLPSFVASLTNSLSVSNPFRSCQITGQGNNLFSALMRVTETKLKSNKTDKRVIPKIKQLRAKLGTFKQHLKTKDPLKNFKDRKKSVVCATLNKVGIVVPVEELNNDDYGYRPLPCSDSELKKTLKRMNKEKEAGDQVNGKQLGRILNFVTYADDEGDPGMGFELGVGFFCSYKMFQDEALRLLSNAYRFLKRDLFTKIASVHIANRDRQSLSQLA